jgi:predicted transcriptional regulator
MRSDNARENSGMAEWTFLTHHAHLLLEVARNPDSTLEELARAVGVTTRSAVKILNDLETNGYLERERRGRRNHYVLHRDRPLRHPSNAAHTVDELIEALKDLN